MLCISSLFVWFESRTDNHAILENKGTVDHRKVNKRLKKFLLVYKNLDNQTRSGRPKSVDSEASESNMVSNSWSVSGDLTSHNPAWFVVIFIILTKSSKATKLRRMLQKYCKTFDSLYYFFCPVVSVWDEKKKSF